MKVELRLAHGSKKVSAPDALPTERSESAPSNSASNLTAYPAQTADLPGVVGWVLASISILVGFVIIAGTTGIDRDQADNRRADSFISEQTTMFRSPSDPIPRDSPMAIVDDIIYSRQSSAPIPQQSVLREEKDTLDGKGIRKALPVEVQKPTPIKPVNPRRAD
jgi:hypothetical protein